MKTIVSLALLIAACSTSMFGMVAVPEIDSSSATTAVMLLGTGVLMLRLRRR